MALAKETETAPCPICGGHFRCAAGEARCWCHAFVLAGETLAALGRLAVGCVCPGCLAELEAAKRS
jgi:Cysteine-rich CWC